MNYLRLSAAGLLALALTFSQTTQATTTVKPPKGKWENLFDGKDLKGWHTYLKAGQPVSDQWAVNDGAIHYTGGRGGGDLVTDKEYGDFELELEWKIAEGANSGVIFHVNEDPKYPATYRTGPEMQVLDNERHPDAKQGKDGNRTAGALYDLQKPITPNAAKSAGEWNKARLIISKGHAEHYLNGKKIADYPTSGPEWDKMVADSKFKNWEGFGKYPVGHIALQDHGDKVWFRNIRIREL